MMSDLYHTDGILFFVLIYLAFSLAGIWISLLIWTIKDIAKRSRSWVARIFAPTLVLVFFVFGLVIYLFLRPRKTLDEEFRENLNEEIMIHSLIKPRYCPDCQQEIRRKWLFCPNCKKQLQKLCVKCGNNLDISWDLCPYCGAENLRSFKDISAHNYNEEMIP